MQARAPFKSLDLNQGKGGRRCGKGKRVASDVEDGEQSSEVGKRREGVGGKIQGGDKIHWGLALAEIV